MNQAPKTQSSQMTSNKTGERTMNRNILTLAFALVFIVMLSTASAEPVWQEIGSSATLSATAQNQGSVDNLPEVFGPYWGVYTKKAETATYTWGTSQRIGYAMLGGLVNNQNDTMTDLIVEYSVDGTTGWTAVPDNYDVSYYGADNLQSVYVPVDVNAKAMRVTLFKETNSSFENMHLDGFRVFGNSNTAQDNMNTSTSIMSNATVDLTSGTWKLDSNITDAATAKARWSNAEAPNTTPYNDGLEADVTSDSATATFTWASDQLLAGMEIANMKNAFDTGGQIDTMTVDVLAEGVDPASALESDWSIQFSYDKDSEASVPVLIDALFADGSLTTRGVRMNILSAFEDNVSNDVARIEEVSFIGGVVIPEPASALLLGLLSFAFLNRRPRRD